LTLARHWNTVPPSIDGTRFNAPTEDHQMAGRASRSRRLLCFVPLALFVSGCGGIRIHDAGREQLSREAVALSATISAGTGDVFGPMEQNLNAVQATQDKLRKLADAHELETFQLILPRLTPSDIAGRLLKAMNTRNQVFTDLKKRESEANQEINDTLNRQTVVTQLLADRADASSTATTLARLRKRLDWLDDVGRALDKLHEGPSSGTAKPDSSGVANEVTAAAGFNKALEAAKRSLKSVDESPTVTAAAQLIRSVAEQALGMEQSRLLAMRQHLAAVQRLAEGLSVRDQITVCELWVPAVGQIHSALTDRTEIDKLLSSLTTSGRYKCLGGGDPIQPLDLRALWAKGTLREYVAAEIKANGLKAKSPELVGALGIILFYERRLFDDTLLNLAREQHLHSIRLSRINAQQRAALVNQLSTGLEVYYRGGIKPETLAQLILAAAQVGAITFVGARQ